MRLPFQQMQQQEAARARMLARALKVPEYQGIGLVVALDAWMLEIAPEGDASGLLPDENTSDQLALAVGWEGGPGALVDAMVLVGVLKRLEDGGLRYPGIEKYADALGAPKRRSEHAKKAAEAMWSKRRAAPTELPACPSMPEHAYTQTQIETQRQKETLPASQGAAVAAPPDDLPDATEHAEEDETPAQRPLLAVVPPSTPIAAKKPKAPKPAESRGDPRHAPLVAALVAADVEVHGQPYGFRGGRDAKAVTDCLAMADQNAATAGEAAPAEVLRRWRIGRRWKGFPGCNSLQDLAANWNAYVREQSPAAAMRAAVGGAVRMDTRPGDFSKLPEGGESLTDD